MAERLVLVVCGLNREAAIAAGIGVVTAAGGGDRLALEARLDALTSRAIGAVVSFGLAGALDPRLRVGAVVCPDEVRATSARPHSVSSEIAGLWRDRLGAHALPVVAGAIAGVDAPVLDRDAKAALATATGAVAVDMESHVAADYAARIDVPFGVLRVISDAAGRTLPPAAAIAMRPDGSIDLAGVLTSVARRPGQIPALIATARDAGLAFRQLGRVRGLLGPGFGLHL